MLAAHEGDLVAVNKSLRRLAQSQKSANVHHYGVSMFNLALCSVAQDRLVDAAAELKEATEAFSGTSVGIELSATLAWHSCVLLRVGRLDEATAIIDGLFNAPAAHVELDAYLDVAAAVDSFGDGTWTGRVLELSGGGGA